MATETSPLMSWPVERSPLRRSSSSSSSTETSSVCSGVSQMSRDILAKKLRQNWLEKSPHLKEIFDDSLTNLNWLHNLTPMSLETSIESSPRVGRIWGTTPAYKSELEPRTPSSSMALIKEEVLEDVGPPLKPPYSYASLICMAMRELGKAKITLSDIYTWITDNFMYYRVADTSWQNSVRHNLSLNKCFEKVPRRKDEPGKGGFWRINPKYANLLENGVSRRRQQQRQNQQQALTPFPVISNGYHHYHHRNYVSNYSNNYYQQRHPGKLPLTQKRTFPSISAAPFVQRRRVLPTWPSVAQYKTAESSDKVDTQMRDLSHLRSNGGPLSSSSFNADDPEVWSDAPSSSSSPPLMLASLEDPLCAINTPLHHNLESVLDLAEVEEEVEGDPSSLVYKDQDFCMLPSQISNTRLRDRDW